MVAGEDPIVLLRAVADRVVILWRGATALDAPARDLTVPEAVAIMVGYQQESAA